MLRHRSRTAATFASAALAATFAAASQALVVFWLNAHSHAAAGP